MIPTVRGQERAQEELRRLDAQTIALTGPEGVGRRLVAWWYAVMLNCQGRGIRPCGACSSCHAAREGHPDHVEISPAAVTSTGRTKRQREIRIHQLVPRSGNDEEPLATWLARRPTYAWRVGVIDGAETLNPAAANAFLKMLEEPPSWARIVLVTPSMDALLPTVASRCTPVRCRPVTTDGFPDLAPHPALETGQVGALHRAVADREAHAAKRAAVDAFVDSLASDLADVLAAADALAEAWLDDTGNDVSQAVRFALRRRHRGGADAADDAVAACERALERYASPALAVRVLGLDLRRLLNPSASR